MRQWRALGPRVIVACALLLLGAGAVVVSTAFQHEPVGRVAGYDTPVDPGARDPGDITANTSPTLTRNPLRPANLAVANRIDTPAFSCALQVSTDGGARWTRVPVPIPRGEEPKCYAPDATFAADGTLYLSYVTLRGVGNAPHAAWLVHSRDGGRTLSTPRRVLGPLAFQVRLTTDPARPRRLYLTWLQASGVGLYRFIAPGNPVEVTRSDDGGITWRRPVRVSDSRRTRVVAPAPAVGPAGDVYVLYLDLRDDRLDYEGGAEGFGGPPYDGRFALVLGRSRDGGASWQQSVVESSLVPTERFLAFLPPFPSLAVDRRSGRIYAAFQDARLSPSDVYVWSLSPGAGAWAGPVRVNDTPDRDGTSQYLPKLAVAPDGRLDVEYYDRRDDAGNRLTQASLQSSFDGGRSFTPRVALSDRAFDSRIGLGSERGLPDLGSRLGLVSDDAQALAAWTDTRAGSVASNKQDIAFARVAFSSSGLSQPLRDALRWGGAALALAGVVLLLARVRPRSYVPKTATGP